MFMALQCISYAVPWIVCVSVDRMVCCIWWAAGEKFLRILFCTAIISFRYFYFSECKIKSVCYCCAPCFMQFTNLQSKMCLICIASWQSHHTNLKMCWRCYCCMLVLFQNFRLFYGLPMDSKEIPKMTGTIRVQGWFDLIPVLKTNIWYLPFTIAISRFSFSHLRTYEQIVYKNYR